MHTPAPKPTLCERSVNSTKTVERGRCWSCAIRAPEGVTFGQIESFGSRGYLHELQKTRHAFLLDGSPRSKTCAKAAKDAMSSALGLVSLDTPASMLAVSSLCRYIEPKSAGSFVSELYRLDLIEPIGKEETTKLSVYQLTAEGRDLLQKWVDLQP